MSAMPDVTSTDEKDWGPEQRDLPAIGSIFLLRLSGSHTALPVSDLDYRFKLVSIDANRDTFRMEKWDLGKWWPGHRWELSMKPTFRVLRAAPVASASSHVGGCVCHRCNASNPWAAPNRPDGKYLCYECR
jgi:hypothetical protein